MEKVGSPTFDIFGDSKTIERCLGTLVFSTSLSVGLIYDICEEVWEIVEKSFVFSVVVCFVRSFYCVAFLFVLFAVVG